MHQEQIYADHVKTQPPHSETPHRDYAVEAGFLLRNQERVFSLIYRIVQDREDARDITQETLFRAVRQKGQVKDLNLLDHWLSRVAKNAAIDFLRRSKVCALRHTGTLCNLPIRSEDTEDCLIRKERVEQLRRMLGTLTERERRALILRDLEGLSASEVAICMGCSPATVRSHIKNAMDKLRKHPRLHNTHPPN